MKTSTLLPAIKPAAQLADQSLDKPLIDFCPADKDVANERLEEFLCECGIAVPEKIHDFLSAVFDLSPYLFDLAKKQPETVNACTKGFSSALKAALSSCALPGEELVDEMSVMAALREMKQRVALVCGLADLGGWWSSDQVAQGITEAADAALKTAVQHLLLNAHNAGKINLPDAENPEQGSGYSILAMGKHGAAELNYSSDIDLIVFFDPEAPAVIDPEESVALFVRLTKNLVKIMQERTADGYVFRTDLRLRPDPGSMPLAIPVDLALTYYESRGQNWERAALIKSRAVAGDMQTAAFIQKELTPFIWRRYLDYAAIADVHSIKRQIQAHKGYSELSIPGHNVKLGRGGIREIEFFVQTQQLIAGGRVPELRRRKTLQMLELLVEHGWIDDLVRSELTQSYRYLRDVEHRLQMVADEQTHVIPEGENDLKRIAYLCGFPDVQTFYEVTEAHLHRVEAHYADLFADAPELSDKQGNLSFTGDEDDPGTVKTLERLGYTQPSNVIALVRGWHFGRYKAMQSAEAREHLTELTPAILESFSEVGKPDETLAAFDSFVKGLPAGFQLFSLLRANPGILSLLGTILGAAPRLANTITRKPHVFDSLLEPGFFDTVPTWEQLTKALDRTLKQALDYEDGLNRARLFAAEQKFLIGARLLSHNLPMIRAGESFSMLAGVMLTAMLGWVREEFEKRHGKIPAAKLAIVGMGNLGTFELTAGSDLDLVLLYQHDEDHDESDGEKPLHASQYFARLTQRLIAAMSAPTAEGIIYELDFRLRPSGNSGPLATSIHSFEKYQSEDAWTWEHMALTRARVICGDGAFIETVQSTIDEIVARPRDRSKISADIYEMRHLMDQERPGQGAWDMKLSRGGIVDLEFLAQWAVLAGLVPKAFSTREVLWLLDGKLQNDNVTLGDAFDSFSGVAQLLRLCLDQSLPPEEWPRGLIDMVLKEMDLPDLTTALPHLQNLKTSVRGMFVEALGKTGSKAG